MFQNEIEMGIVMPKRPRSRKSANKIEFMRVQQPEFTRADAWLQHRMPRCTSVSMLLTSENSSMHKVALDG
jgi:hypothetical protein